MYPKDLLYRFCYIYYKADLLEIASQYEGTRLGFIGDITHGIQGHSEKENVRKLKLILNEAEERRKKHGVQFEPSKYVLCSSFHTK